MDGQSTTWSIDHAMLPHVGDCFASWKFTRYLQSCNTVLKRFLGTDLGPYPSLRIRALVCTYLSKYLDKYLLLKNVTKIRLCCYFIKGILTINYYNQVSRYFIFQNFSGFQHRPLVVVKLFKYHLKTLVRIIINVYVNDVFLRPR